MLMASIPRLRNYGLDLKTRRGEFSVGFTAVNDVAALAQVSEWIVRNPIAGDGILRVTGPDGRDVIASQKAPVLARGAPSAGP